MQRGRQNKTGLVTRVGAYSTSTTSPNSKSQRRRYLFQKIVLNRRMMSNSGVCTVWEDNSPDSLLDLAAQCVLQNPHTLFTDQVRIPQELTFEGQEFALKKSWLHFHATSLSKDQLIFSSFLGTFCSSLDPSVLPWNLNCLSHLNPPLTQRTLANWTRPRILLGVLRGILVSLCTWEPYLIAPSGMDIMET